MGNVGDKRTLAKKPKITKRTSRSIGDEDVDSIRKRTARSSSEEVECKCGCNFMCGEFRMQCSSCSINVLRKQCHSKDRLCSQCFNTKKSTWHKNRLAKEKAAFALACQDDIPDKFDIWATFESPPSVESMEPLLSIWDALPPSLTGKNAADIKSTIFSDNGNAIITLESTLDDWDKNESAFACRRDIRTLRIHTTTRGETVQWWLNGGVHSFKTFNASC